MTLSQGEEDCNSSSEILPNMTAMKTGSIVDLKKAFVSLIGDLIYIEYLVEIGKNQVKRSCRTLPTTKQ